MLVGRENGGKRFLEDGLGVLGRAMADPVQNWAMEVLVHPQARGEQKNK